MFCNTKKWEWEWLSSHPYLILYKKIGIIIIENEERRNLMALEVLEALSVILQFCLKQDSCETCILA